MKIDLTCPAELWRYELPKADYPACDLMMNNLSDKTIVSVEVTLILSDPEGDELERLIYRAHDLDGRPSMPFAMTVPMEGEVTAKAMELIIEKVWFTDNSVWRRGKSPLSEYTPNTLPNSRSLEMLRFVAGSNAVGFPQEQDGLWLCVCGRANADYSRSCVRCHREREQVFTQYNREAIEKLVSQREQQLALKAKAAREDASRLQLQREAEYQKKKKKRRRIMVVVVTTVACAAAAYGVVFHLVPFIHYRSAVATMEEGRYAEAQTAFVEMGDYADAADYVTRCRYLAAKEDLISTDQAVLAGAKTVFAALGNYEDSEELGRQADYRRAGLLLSTGSTADARAIYVALGDYEDCPTKVQQCDYLDADKLLADGKYTEAQTAFLALGDYSDAASKAMEAVYLPAKAALAQEDADTAIARLGTISGYKDAEDLLQQAYYVKGTQLRDAGNMEEAGDAFLVAGDYADAENQANTCIYAPALSAYESGDYLTAVDLFAKILPYQDATAKYQECAYQLARSAISDTEYTRALSLLQTLPDSYEDVLELRQQCVYFPAVTALRNENWQAAVDGFSQVSTYRDSSDLLLRARYGLGQGLMNEGQYEDAIAQFMLLGDYDDSADQLRTARYQQGVALLDEGDFQSAAVLFSDLGDYRDSEDRYHAAIYGQAEILIAAGDTVSARPLYASLGEYSDAAVKVQACDYAAAATLADSGETLAAAQSYEALGNYEDAADLAHQLYYTLGIQAQSEGQIVVSARYFAKAGDYEDAQTLATAAFDSYYQEPSVAAQDAMDNGEYPLVITLLSNMDLTELPERYAFLTDLLKEANYQEGNRLYNAGKPYEALPYYRAIPDYKDVASKLERNCYMILGTWSNSDGQVFIFRDNGTCSLNGEELSFMVNNYAMDTGATSDHMSLTHRVSSVNETSLTLRDTRSEPVKTYHLTRQTTEETAEVTPTETTAPTQTPADILSPEDAADSPTPSSTEASEEVFTVIDD